MALDIITPPLEARVRAYAQSVSVAEILDELYALQLPQHAADTFASLSQSISLSGLPLNEVRFLKLLEQGSLTQKEQLVFLHIGWKKYSEGTKWLSFNIAKLLSSLHSSGEITSLKPYLAPFFIVATSDEGTATTRGFAQRILARELSQISPRDSLKYAVQATLNGDSEALRSARAAADCLNLSLPDKLKSVGAVKSLAALLGMRNVSYPETVTPEDSCVRSFSAHAEAEVTLFPPKNDVIHYVFRDNSAKRRIPAIDIFEFVDGVVSIDVSRRGLTQLYIYDHAERLVEALSVGLSPFIADDPITIENEVCVVDDNYSGTMNICHFLLDKIPRIGLYAQHMTDGTKILFADSYPYYRNFLELGELIDRCIFPPSRRFTVRAKRLLVSSDIQRDFVHPAHGGQNWATSYTSSLAPVSSLRPFRKLFISREDGRGRRIRNWEDVKPVLMSFEFEIIELSGLSVAEQIQLFREAVVVAGVHGAGLTNIVFSSPGCTVLEILPPFVATWAYWRLAAAKSHQYYAIVGADPEWDSPNYLAWVHDAKYNPRDIVLDLSHLTSILGVMGLTAKQ